MGKLKKGQPLFDFLALKSIYNSCLFQAVISMDARKVFKVLNRDYSYEIENNFVTFQPIDLDELRRKLQ